MSLSGTLKAKCINGISPYGEGWNRHIEIEVEDMDISQTFAVEDVLAEYGIDDVLDAVGEDKVISWIESQGFSINPS